MESTSLNCERVNEMFQPAPVPLASVISVILQFANELTWLPFRVAESGSNVILPPDRLPPVTDEDVVLAKDVVLNAVAAIVNAAENAIAFDNKDLFFINEFPLDIN